MYRDTIFQYVKKQYGTIPEYLWNDLPDSAILRNDNGKWYAVFMNLEGFKIGLDTKDRVDIKKLESGRYEVRYATALTELDGGQKLVRFYDPSGNLIEVRTPWDKFVNRE